MPKNYTNFNNKNFSRQNREGNNNMSKHATYIFLILVSFVVGVVIGSLVVCKYLNNDSASTQSMYQSTNQATSTPQYDNTFDDGWAAAKQKLIDTGYFMESETRQLSGSIESADDNSIVLSVSLLNPLDPDSLKKRTVKIDNNTKFVINRNMTRDEIEAQEAANKEELDALRVQYEATEDMNEKMDLEMQMMDLEMGMIDYMKTEEVNKYELNANDYITVKADDNIAVAQSFTASEIVKQEMASPDMGMMPPIDDDMMSPVEDMPAPAEEEILPPDTMDVAPIEDEILSPAEEMTEPSGEEVLPPIE